MKFAVRGCTPPSTPPSAHPNAHPQLQHTSASSLSSSSAINSAGAGQTQHGMSPHVVTAQISNAAPHSHHVHTSQFTNMSAAGTLGVPSGDQDIHQQNLAHAHALQLESQLQSIGEDVPMEDVGAVGQSQGHVVADELMHLSHAQVMGAGVNTSVPQPVVVAPPPSQVHFDALSSMPPVLTQQVSPRACTAPNHVLFIGAPYRWPQPRSISQAALKDAFSSVGMEQ